MKFEEWLAQQDGVIEVDCGCVTAEAFYHWMRVAYEAGNFSVVPDGYVMVPKEPTDEMLAAAKEWTGLTSTAEVVYIKMLEAAPQSPGCDHATVPGKWIPVTERMPKTGQEVLCVDHFGNYETAYYSTGYMSGLPFFATTAGEFHPTHWMPLPAGPKEQDNV